MTFNWPTKSPQEANETREQKTVVISRHTNGWPFGDNTGLFGGSLLWIVEALGAAPAESCLYFQSFNDAYDLPAGIETTRSCLNRGAIASTPLDRRYNRFLARAARYIFVERGGHTAPSKSWRKCGAIEQKSDLQQCASCVLRSLSMAPLYNR